MEELKSYKLVDYGDSGILIDFSEHKPEKAWLGAHYVAKRLRAQNMKGVLGIIPTYSTLYVHFNCARIDRKMLVTAVAELIETLSSGADNYLVESKHFRIPVLFGAQWGEDLPNVAVQLGISETQVVDLFCSKPYKIMCLASPIGQPLLDAPPFEKSVSRLPSPRTRVPAGSVSVIGKQANIYTLESPGGWQLIGQTPVKLVNLANDIPVVYKPGDYLEFVPITEDKFNSYKGKTIQEMEVTK